jgi:broad specificity phosphatase PhoE
MEVAEPFSMPTFETPEAVPSEVGWVAFVRHAQAGHNVDKALVRNPDNHLTDVGSQQAIDARDAAAGRVLREADLVVTSPLMRAMQTTELLLGEKESEARVMVHPLVTECLTAPCDKGTEKSELLEKVPDKYLQWEGWDSLPERWWPEPGEDSWARALAFIEFARQRPEKRIAFVGHGNFWSKVCGQYLSNCGAVVCERTLPVC